MGLGEERGRGEGVNGALFDALVVDSESNFSVFLDGFCI
jgi:hypothetical protein